MSHQACITHQASSAKHQTSSIQQQASRIDHQAPSIKQASIFKHQASSHQTMRRVDYQAIKLFSYESIKPSSLSKATQLSAGLSAASLEAPRLVSKSASIGNKHTKVGKWRFVVAALSRNYYEYQTQATHIFFTLSTGTQHFHGGGQQSTTGLIFFLKICISRGGSNANEFS